MKKLAFLFAIMLAFACASTTLAESEPEQLSGITLNLNWDRIHSDLQEGNSWDYLCDFQTEADLRSARYLAGDFSGETAGWTCSSEGLAMQLTEDEAEYYAGGQEETGRWITCVASTSEPVIDTNHRYGVVFLLTCDSEKYFFDDNSTFTVPGAESLTVCIPDAEETGSYAVVFVDLGMVPAAQDVPQTGDNSAPVLCGCLLLISAAGFAVLQHRAKHV